MSYGFVDCSQLTTEKLVQRWTVKLLQAKANHSAYLYFIAEPNKRQDEKALAIVERQNSGSQAESTAGTSKTKAGHFSPE